MVTNSIIVYVQKIVAVRVAEHHHIVDVKQDTHSSVASRQALQTAACRHLGDQGVENIHTEGEEHGRQGVS